MKGRVLLLTGSRIIRERNGSESHSVTTPTTTPGQYREVRPESNTEEGNTHAKDYLKWFGSLVQQHRAIRVIVFLLSVWYFVDWLEKYTGFYLFTNYQNVGIWTHQLQEHLLWTVILGFAVLWYFSSVQYLLLCVLVVFVLPRIVYRLNRKFGIY